jgi:hypothetical protein
MAPLAAQRLETLYSPLARPLILVGLGGFEPPTSPLSGVRSNQLSYRPALLPLRRVICVDAYARSTQLFKGGDPAAGSPTATLLRLHPSH